MIHDSFYDALAMQAAAIEAAVPDMPEHRFSLRYRRKKKSLIKAYEQKKARDSDIPTELHRIRARQAIRIAILVVLSLMLLTGAGMYVTHYIGGLQANQQSTHSDVFALDWENAPRTLENDYRIAYDLSDWNCEVLSDNILKYWENYTNGDKFLNYLCFTKEAFQNMQLNTEDAVIEKREISGYEALFFTNEEGSRCYIWNNDNYVFEIITNIDDDTAIKIAESIEAVKYRITYDLSSFTKEIVLDDSVMYWETYSSSDVFLDYLCFTKEAYQNVRLNTEGSTIENVKIGDCDALFFTTSDGTRCFDWDTGEYVLQLSSNMDHDTLLQIAESIKTN